MTQLTIFDNPDPEPVRTENKLTTRQWRLHDLILAHSLKGALSLNDMLLLMDDEYGYSKELADYPNRAFHNLSSRRELSDDLDAIIKCPTIQHVYVGGKYATSEEEALEYLQKQKASALAALKKVYIQYKKLSLDGQQRLILGKEQGHWEAILREEKE